MGAPHNKERYGETWSQERLDATLCRIRPLRPHVVLSGGWAWHFMSPDGHPEYKHAHDHKDVDMFVHPVDIGMIIGLLSAQGFLRVSTRYDSVKKDFMRYERHEHIPGGIFKITLDVFLKSVPFRVVRDQWRVVEPKYLLSLYDSVHTSGECFAVAAAKKLMAEGVDPVDNELLVKIPD